MPLRPLSEDDFPLRPALTRAFLRSVESWLSDEAFANKVSFLWPQGAWAAMRAHPAGYWADLAQIDADSLPGGAGTCLGDAHFDNFGFIQLSGEKTYIFAPNDLDDGGAGLVALDALKYFTVLAGHPRLTRHVDPLIELYAAALRHPEEERHLPKKFWPKPEDVRKKKLLKYTEGAAIKVEALPFQSLPLPEAERELVKEAVASAPQLRGAHVIDVVDQYKLSGGSYGVRRYWALVDRGGKSGVDLLEFKEMTTPATSLGRYTEVRSQSDRVKFLKKAMWSSESDEDYFVASFDERHFLVRSRLRKATLAPLELGDPEDLMKVLEAQVCIMADLHRPAMEGVKREPLRAWIRASADMVLRRWNGLLEHVVPPLPPAPSP